jgi:hypothetical protein
VLGLIEVKNAGYCELESIEDLATPIEVTTRNCYAV